MLISLLLLAFSLPAISMEQKQPELWVFGYGSLIWNPGFNYSHTYKAHATGFARRMYQGNVHHRGNTSFPGRVATLVKDQMSSTSGLVFRIEGMGEIEKALEHLRERELANGYHFFWIDVQIPLEGASEGVVRALTCIATKQNQFYLGVQSMDNMAAEIVEAKGVAGPNSDYVLKLADQIRLLFPLEKDDHLYELERRIRQKMRNHSTTHFYGQLSK